MEEKCEFCKYYYDKWAGCGVCRRYPPEVFIPDVEAQPISVLPEVDAEDYCGDFKGQAQP